MKTRPITLRFEEDHLNAVMKGEGFKSAQQAANWLFARYYWTHQLAKENGGIPLPADYVSVGKVSIAGRPLLDTVQPEPQGRQFKHSFEWYLSQVKDLEIAEDCADWTARVLADEGLTSRQKETLQDRLRAKWIQ
jgi:hypothetical protein